MVLTFHARLPRPSSFQLGGRPLLNWSLLGAIAVLSGLLSSCTTRSEQCIQLSHPAIKLNRQLDQMRSSRIAYDKKYVKLHEDAIDRLELVKLQDPQLKQWRDRYLEIYNRRLKTLQAQVVVATGSGQAGGQVWPQSPAYQALARDWKEEGQMNDDINQYCQFEDLGKTFELYQKPAPLPR